MQLSYNQLIELRYQTVRLAADLDSRLTTTRNPFKRARIKRVIKQLDARDAVLVRMMNSARFDWNWNATGLL